METTLTLKTKSDSCQRLYQAYSYSYAGAWSRIKTSGALRNVIKGVRHGKALEGAPPVDPHKLGGAEGGLKFMMGLRSEDGLVLETEERHKAGLTPEKELWVTISLAQGKPSLLHIKWNEEVNGTQLENLKGKRVETKLDNSSILGKPPLLNNERDQLLKQIASLESKLASQDIRSCQKEYHELRTSYNALKVKFDSLNRKKWNINVSKSSKPKESVSEKVHTGESSKTSLRRVSQFTTYSLQKDRKFSKKSQSFETFFPQKGFKTRASNAKNQSFETSHSCFTPVKQVWRPIKESQTFEASTSQKSFKTSTLKGKNQVFVTPHSRFTPVKQVWRPKQSHSKSFKYSKTEMLLMQNKNDSVLKNKNSGRFSNGSKMNLQNNTPIVNNKWKYSSSTRFKNPQETPSFNNQ
ncbi:hypothetical protein Tco_0377466 [Tanacetum coccineum]